MSNILAIKYLGEKPVWKYDLPSMCLIILGCLTIVCLSSYAEQTYTAEDIMRLIERPSSICLLSLSAFVFAMAYIYVQWFFKQLDKFNGEINIWLST